MDYTICENENSTQFVHEHDWTPDGESFTKTNHENGCEWNNGSHRGYDKLECIKNCEQYRVRRYTCHCGESKTVRLKDSGDKN